MKDSTIFRRHWGFATRSQRLEFCLQAAQCRQPLRDVSDMRVENCIDLVAALFGFVPEAEQMPNFLMRHVERAAVEDEFELFSLAHRVEAIVPFAASWFGKQTFPLVVTDRLDSYGQQGRQIANAVGLRHRGTSQGA